MDEFDIMGMDDDFGGIGGMGTDEIIGAEDFDLDDVDAIMGMDPVIGGQKAKLRKVASRMAKLREVDPNAVLVRQRRLDRRRRFPLGFERAVIAGGATQNVNANPQNLFRSERIVVPSNLAFDFFINDIRVGQTSQLVSSGQIPAALFSEVAIDTNVHFKTAEIGNVVTLSLVNDTTQDVNFGAAVIGTVAL